MRFLKLQEDTANCIYTFVFDKEIKEEDICEIINDFRKIEEKAENISEIKPIKRKREGEEEGEPVIKELFHVGRDSFSVAVYPDKKIAQYSCRKRAKNRFEKILFAMGYLIKNP